MKAPKLPNRIGKETIRIFGVRGDQPNLESRPVHEQKVTLATVMSEQLRTRMEGEGARQ